MAEYPNKDIAAEMRDRYPGIPPKLARDLGIEGWSSSLPVPSTEISIPHPPQERYTRAEIRAMIDVALPEIKETQRARARDLFAERDGHGY